MNSESSFDNIDQYIAGFPPAVRELLEQMRKVIHDAAPQAEEAIRYQMPTFILNGNLVHFAAYKKHIGFYPAPSGIEAFRESLTGYKTSKGAIQFPLGEPVPFDLVRKIVLFRVQENMAKRKR